MSFSSQNWNYTMTEDEIRELMGFGGPREIVFAGQQWKIRDDCLSPLLIYAQSGIKAGPEGKGGDGLAALHQLFESCLVDFAAFSLAAYESKATLDEVQAVGRRIVELSCARGFWPSMRLLSYIIASLAEFDGMVLRSGGRGLAGLSAREACNLALAICLDGRDDESREEFFTDLNYEGSPDAEALAALRQMQAARKAAEEAAKEAGDGPGPGDHVG